MKNIVCIVIIIMIAFISVSCNFGKKEKPIPTLMTVEDVTSLPKEDLSSSEIESLYKAVIQEYLTKNVYLQISTKFSTEEPFLTAFNEEEKIIQLISALLSKYQLALPGDETLAESLTYINKIRYRTDACEMGNDLEFKKYTMYDDLLKDVDNQDIQKVYVSILKSSVEKNMKLFEECKE